jgi:DNA-binding MurR/RpiR family transcriptional regulator
MEAPRDFEALKRRLIEIEPLLPKRLRQTAAFALAHPDEVALGTASGVAQRAEVQASTLVRFAQSLGFAGFSELQGVFRSHLRTRWPDYSERLKALHESARASGDPMNLLFGFADSAAQSIVKLRETTRRDELDGAIEILAGANTIYLVGQRRSFSVSHYLAYALAQLGLKAILVDNVGGLGPDQLSSATAEDALIAVSFSPYAPTTIAFAEKARARKTPLVVITDSALSPLAGMADARFEVVESDFGAFRSLAATFCLAMTLAVAVAERRAEAAKDVKQRPSRGAAKPAALPDSH